MVITLIGEQFRSLCLKNISYHLTVQSVIHKPAELNLVSWACQTSTLSLGYISSLKLYALWLLFVALTENIYENMYKTENMYVYKVREMRGTIIWMTQTFIPN